MPIIRDVPSTVIVTVATAPGPGPGTVVFRGALFKAIVVDQTLNPSEGDTVLADYLRTSSEFVISNVGT